MVRSAAGARYRRDEGELTYSCVFRHTSLVVLQPAPENRPYPKGKAVTDGIVRRILICRKLIGPLFVLDCQRHRGDDVGTTRQSVTLLIAFKATLPSADDGRFADGADTVTRRQNRKQKVLVPRRGLGDGDQLASRPDEVLIDCQRRLQMGEHIVNGVDNGGIGTLGVPAGPFVGQEGLKEEDASSVLKG